MPNHILTNLQPQTLILTPTQNLSDYLQHAYLKQQLQQQRQSWPSYCCLTIKQWYQTLWQSYLSTTIDNHYLLLTKQQELILWGEIISNSAFNQGTLNNQRLAREAQAAWTFLQTWCCHNQQQDVLLNANRQAFNHWAEEFALYCQTKHWLSQASLADFLANKIISKTVKLPQHLILVNFIELTQQDTNFLVSCSKAGITISHQQYFHQGNTSSKIMFTDASDELYTMLAWAQKIRQHDKHSSIAGLVSNLAEQQDKIRQLSTEILNPTEHLILCADQVLANTAISQHALNLLSLPADNIPLSAISILLHSPFLLASQQELAAQLSLDCMLRDNYWQDMPWPSLLQLLRQYKCNFLAKRLSCYYQLRSQQPQLQNISCWATTFINLLTTAGWPGRTKLTTSEKQIFQQWQHVLQEMASLSIMLPTAINYPQALAYLEVLATTTHWQQPNTYHDQENLIITIIEPLEAASTPFTYLWVTGMDDQTWPLTITPTNRFLPYRWHKQQKLFNTQHQLTTSSKIFANFKTADKQVIFSAVQQVAKVNNFSTLLKTVALTTPEALNLAALPTKSQQIFANKHLEPISNDQPPPITTAQPLKGGASIFTLQAACPFKAFAKLRLHAKTVAAYSAALTAKYQAKIIQRVLLLLWQEMHDQTTLQQLTTVKLDKKINYHLNQVLAANPARTKPDTVYDQLIRNNLLNTIKQWLAQEQARPFFTVVAQEQRQTIKLAGYTLSYRLARIDELADTSQIVINYTSKAQCNKTAWLGDRPTAPQLPLYLVTATQQLSGIAYAQLNPRSMKFISLTANDTTINWQTQLDLWQQQQLALLTEFVMSNTSVEPKQSSTCYYCNLPSLCRINSLKNAAIPTK